jgi:addiction module HigA family antidote
LIGGDEDMKNLIAAQVFPPGDFLREELEARGWTQADLAKILGRPRRLIGEIIEGKRAITAETAWGLGDAFGVDPQFWLNLESAYQLSRVRRRDSDIATRAKLIEKTKRANSVATTASKLLSHPKSPKAARSEASGKKKRLSRLAASDKGCSRR